MPLTVFQHLVYTNFQILAVGWLDNSVFAAQDWELDSLLCLSGDQPTYVAVNKLHSLQAAPKRREEQTTSMNLETSKKGDQKWLHM